MITGKAFDRFRDDQGTDEALRGLSLSYSHFVHLGSVGPDYPYLDFVQVGQKEWAGHMHYRHTGDAIKAMALRLLNLGSGGFRQEDFYIPFLLDSGLSLSHVTADLAVHPVVYNIVGPCKGNEARHRNCETIQDAFIYHQIRGGAEIEHSELMRIIQICCNPSNKAEIHPILRHFWGDILKALFSAYEINHPDL